MARRLIFLLALAGACRSAPPSDDPQAVDTTPVEARPEDAATREIASIEAFGEDPDGRLTHYLAAGSTAERRRAAIALGRLSSARSAPGTPEALVAALADPEPEVRAAVAFALGQRREAGVAAALAEALADPDPAVRAAAVTAASRCAPGELLEDLLFAIGDTDSGVRSAALLAPHRLDTAHPSAGLVDAALVNFALRAPSHLLRNWGPIVHESRVDLPEPAEISEIELAVFSLARRRSERARDIFALWAQAEAPTAVRLFALQGLGSLEVLSLEELELLRTAAQESDWRVAVEGLRGLAQHPAPENLQAIVALDHASPHVRRVAAESLATFFDQRSLVLPNLERASVDPSSSVRAAVIATRAKLSGDDFAADLEMLAFDADPVVRAGVAEAAGALPSERAIPLLTSLARDRYPRVAGTAVMELGKHLDGEGRQRLHIFLSHEDGGIRLAALVALAQDPQPEDVPHLEYAWRTSEGEIAQEIRSEVLHRAAAIPGQKADDLLWRGVESDEPYIAELARRLVAERAPGTDFPPLLPIPGTPPRVPAHDLSPPLVELHTSRGLLLFELAPGDAPRHVHNFVELVKSGHYDGLDWHRVVPDFVAQGGDHRGDGNGSRTFDGRPLRREFTARPFRRGSLGMPRNQNPDSGGSQIFVCHRATPHLDGNYTAFGELVQGFEVLDALEVGDRIHSARLRGAGGR
jgi:cyclophilin family peptidyl-prolyl cis-trans isomerase/HEAT repeat protein